MATGRAFTARASVPLIIDAANSVGAHLAAKLAEFVSDERTLTDELCDMLCIWSQAFGASGAMSIPGSRVPGATFDLSLRKTTTSEEARTGADLKLTVTSPLGSKTALIQAKVFDSTKDSLRYDATKDWDRLRKQLANAQQEVDDLAFLLLYIPATLLDGAHHGFPTWEQGFVSSVGGPGTSSKYGATFIAANKLVNKRNAWKSKKRLAHLGAAQFEPAGISFGRLILEMLACRRGTWTQSELSVDPDDRQETDPPYRRLDMSIGVPSEMSFERLSVILRGLLDELGSESDAL